MVKDIESVYENLKAELADVEAALVRLAELGSSAKSFEWQWAVKHETEMRLEQKRKIEEEIRDLMDNLPPNAVTSWLESR